MRSGAHEVILGRLFGRRERVLFDLRTGQVKPALQSLKIAGSFHIEAGHVYALYADGGVLHVQRDTARWPITAPGLGLAYGHDLASQTTWFELAGHRISYPAWWRGDPAFEPALPERDEDEDYLAYLVSVWRQPELQASLLQAWDAPPAG